MLAFLIATASASPMIASIGDDVALAAGGGWARALPAGDGSWRFLWAAGGEYNVVPMSADLVVEDRDRLELTGRDDLEDHAFVPCADGTFLHAASASVALENDSIYGFRYDADLRPLASGVVAEGTEGVQNDPAALCAGADVGLDLVGVGYGKVTVYRLDGQASTSETISLVDAPQLMGGSLLWEEETASIVSLGVVGTSPLRIVRYDVDFQLIEARELDLPPEGEHAYWPQSVLRVGDWYVLAYMSRDLEAGFSLDGGNVHLAVFDLDWNLVESAQVTHWSPPDGGMRPSLAIQGDRLLVLYDRLVTPHVVPVTLDLAAFGVADEDGGGSDTGGEVGEVGPPDVPPVNGPPADDDGEAATAAPIPFTGGTRGVGCATGEAASGLAGVLAALVATTRRRARR